MDNPDDYIGKKYPNTELMVLYKTSFYEGKKLRSGFKVKCSCGTVKTVRAQHLKNRNTISCGSATCSYSSIFKKQQNSIKFTSGDGKFFMNGSVFAKYKKNAENRNLQFLITEADVYDVWKKQDGKCYLTGLTLTCGTNRRNHDWSIDRIDNSVGYTKDNISLVHKTMNILRNRFSIEEFVIMCNLVSRTHDKSEYLNNNSEKTITSVLKESLKESKNERKSGSN